MLQMNSDSDTGSVRVIRAGFRLTGLVLRRRPDRKIVVMLKSRLQQH